MNDAPLTDETFILYCSKHYDGRYCATMDDFTDDLARIKYIKKLVTRFQTTGELKERLILNHIIVLYNVFGAVPTARILFFKLRKQFDIIKPFLILIGIMPEYFYNIDNDESIINTDEIGMNNLVVTALREL